jgi:hypothetical protein
MTAQFSTADRLNTPEPEPTQEEVLAEAFRIVRGETMMLATKKHLVALAGLNQEMLEALENLENDDNNIPDHAWKLVQDAIAKNKAVNCG